MIDVNVLVRQHTITDLKKVVYRFNARIKKIKDVTKISRTATCLFFILNIRLCYMRL